MRKLTRMPSLWTEDRCQRTDYFHDEGGGMSNAKDPKFVRRFSCALSFSIQQSHPWQEASINAIEQRRGMGKRYGLLDSVIVRN